MKRQVFVTWFVVFIVWALFRAYFHLPEQVDEYLVKPLLFVIPVLAIVWVWEDKKLADLGLGAKPLAFFLDLYIGIVIGILFAIEGILANYLKYRQIFFIPIDAAKLSGGVGSFLLLNLATSFSEEVLGRGYMYNRLYRSTNKQFWSALVSSFLFMLLHIPIMFTRLQLMGPSMIVYPLSILIMGVTNCYLLSARKSLTLPILLHTFWNMTVALYL